MTLIERVGVIGTGKIGNPMANNLLSAGYHVEVCDVREEAYKDLVQAGAIARETPAGIAAGCEVIILSLVNPNIVEEVLFGKDGAAESDLSGKIIIDTSTSSPSATEKFAERIGKKGGTFLDAPVTGGEGGAREGTLNIMVGGPKQAFEKCKPILDVLGEKITLVGESGAGHVAKLANQMIMSSYFSIIAEAFSFVENKDVDLERVLEVIEDGGAQSSCLSNMANQYRQERREGKAVNDTHYTGLFKKDMELALEEGKEDDFYMPTTSTAHEVIKQVVSSEAKGSFPLKFIELWRKFL